MPPDGPRPSRAYDDALFEPDDLDPVSIQINCKEAVESWPILAIGERPQDWFMHDLLLRRQRRDRRLWLQRVMMQGPPAWIQARVQHLPGAGARQASPYERGIQLTVLHYLHYLQLYRVRNWILDDQKTCDPPYLLLRLERLMKCPPAGALYEKRPQARPCGLLQLCPWCRTRFAVHLWHRLQAAGHDTELVLLRDQVTSDSIETPSVAPGQCPSFAERYQVNQWYTDIDYDDPRDLIFLNPPPETDTPLDPYDFYACLTSRQMKFARLVLDNQLVHWGSRLGLDAGYKFVTIEPTAALPDPGTKFRKHRWWGYILAPIPAMCPEPELWKALAWVDLIPSGFDLDTRKILETGSARRLLTEILGWPSLSLFDGRQYWHYHVQTWRRPLYIPFGSWRTLLARPTKQDSFASQPARELALRRGNYRRHKTAATQLERLLEIARPLWQQIRGTPRRAGRGRPPLRQRLKEMLTQRHIEITEWQLRRVLAALQKGDKGGR